MRYRHRETGASDRAFTWSNYEIFNRADVETGTERTPTRRESGSVVELFETKNVEGSCHQFSSVTSVVYIFGSVTPRWPWYLPPRSLYEVSQTSSDSKNTTCATPSFA